MSRCRVIYIYIYVYKYYYTLLYRKDCDCIYIGISVETKVIQLLVSAILKCEEYFWNVIFI